MGNARRSGEDDKAKEAKKKEEEALRARLEKLKKADEAMRRHKPEKK